MGGCSGRQPHHFPTTSKASAPHTSLHTSTSCELCKQALYTSAIIAPAPLTGEATGKLVPTNSGDVTAAAGLPAAPRPPAPGLAAPTPTLPPPTPHCTGDKAEALTEPLLEAGTGAGDGPALEAIIAGAEKGAGAGVGTGAAAGAGRVARCPAAPADGVRAEAVEATGDSAERGPACALLVLTTEAAAVAATVAVAVLGRGPEGGGGGGGGGRVLNAGRTSDRGYLPMGVQQQQHHHHHHHHHK